MKPDSRLRLIIHYKRHWGGRTFPSTGWRDQLREMDEMISDTSRDGRRINAHFNENDEAFILRLLRRVRESYDEPQDPSLVIHADEIEFRLYRDDGTFFINPITSEGDFSLPWPEPDGFFNWRAKELF